MSQKKTDLKNIATPAEHEVPGLIDRAKVIKQELAALTEELKLVEAKLAKYAQTQEHEDLKDKEREGKQVVLRSARWALPVRFTSDELIGSFADKSPKHWELMDILAKEPGCELHHAPREELLKRFFNPPSKWERKFEDGQKFRAAVGEWLSKEGAPKFIAACRQVDKHGIPKSKTVVALDDATAVESEVAS